VIARIQYVGSNPFVVCVISVIASCADNVTPMMLLRQLCRYVKCRSQLSPDCQKIYLSALCGTQAPDVESDVVMTTETVQSASRDVDIATLGIVVSSSRRELGKLIIIVDRSEKRSNLPEM
jgi:hypothetical protein